MKQRVRELAHFGGFSDSEYLKRTLAKEFLQLECWYGFLSLYTHIHKNLMLVIQLKGCAKEIFCFI